MNKRGASVLQFTIFIAITFICLTIFGLFASRGFRALWGEQGDPEVQDMKRIVAQVIALTDATQGRSVSDFGFGSQARLILQGSRSPVSVGRCPRGENCICVEYAQEKAGQKVGSVYCEVLPKVKDAWFGGKSGFAAQSDADCPSVCGGNVVCVPDGIVNLELEPKQNVRIIRRCNALSLEKVVLS